MSEAATVKELNLGDVVEALTDRSSVCGECDHISVGDVGFVSYVGRYAEDSAKMLVFTFVGGGYACDTEIQVRKVAPAKLERSAKHALGVSRAAITEFEKQITEAFSKDIGEEENLPDVRSIRDRAVKAVHRAAEASALIARYRAALRKRGPLPL